MIINGGGRKGSEITKISANFYESDDLPKETQFEILKRLPPPTCLVETLRSIHCYYKSDGKTTVDAFSPMQRKLIQCQNGDRAISDLARPMRCPGFYHMKTEEPFLCRLLEYHPERIYSRPEFEASLDSLLEAEGKPPNGFVETVNSKSPKKDLVYEKGSLVQLDFMCEHCLFMQHCRNNAKILAEPDWLGMVTNMTEFDGGPERIHEYSRLYPRYSVEETNRKIQHYLDSGTAPMRCETLAEKGFVCPKLEDGGCAGAKAPAALPFKLQGIRVYDKDKMKWYRKTKTGLALSRGVLAEEMKRQYPSIYSSGRFFLYRDGVYRKHEDLEAEREIQNHLLPEYATSSDISDVYKQWAMKVFTAPENLNPDANVINVRNGLFDVRTGLLSEHSSDYISTIQIHARYVPGSTCPTLIQLITDSLGEEYVPLIGQIIGYICTTSVKAEKAFFFVGAAATGKSTLIRLMESLVGEENKSSIAWQRLGEPFQVADLFGKILNSNADLPSMALNDAGVFKQLVSGDRQSTSRKFKDSFEFYPFAKFLFACNDMAVSVSDRTLGFFRRIILVPFKKTVPEHKRDPYLLDKLLAERDGILTFALDQLRILVQNRYQFIIPEASKEELERYMQACNSAILFLNEHCKVTPGSEILRQELYDCYKAFCDRFSLKAMSQTNFNRDVEKVYAQEEIRRSRSSEKRQHTWIGISYDPHGECEGADFDYVLGLSSTPTIVKQIEQDKQLKKTIWDSLQSDDELLDY